MTKMTKKTKSVDNISDRTYTNFRFVNLIDK